MQDRRGILFFTGIKHSGKTTFAKRIASRLGFEFKDADDLISAHIGDMSVREFYRQKGKEAFMEVEKEAVSSFLSSAPSSLVLSLGGGASDNTPLMEEMKEKGTIIYLRREKEDMLPVILRNGVPAFLDKDDIQGSFSALYERRDGIYRRYADLIVDLGPYGDKDQTENLIYRALKEKNYV